MLSAFLRDGSATGRGRPQAAPSFDGCQLAPLEEGAEGRPRQPWQREDGTCTKPEPPRRRAEQPEGRRRLGPTDCPALIGGDELTGDNEGEWATRDWRGGRAAAIADCPCALQFRRPRDRAREAPLQCAAEPEEPWAAEWKIAVSKILRSANSPVLLDARRTGDLSTRTANRRGPNKARARHSAALIASLPSQRRPPPSRRQL
mmetsp:Transcript_8833/g.18756  ORF Transcript_8833/g.18756 Transcript_8833/m.18756 type:complete len:203 (-) Transcript_8833:766-1374(-)